MSIMLPEIDFERIGQRGKQARLIKDIRKQNSVRLSAVPIII